MTFYLGTHKAGWLTRTEVPLFVSRRTLCNRKSLPRAMGRWALDSGGFTELNMFGRWETSARQYADEATRFMHEIGGLDFAAIQDWMCEPFVIEGTGKSVREHQQLSIQSWIELRELAPAVPWLPVLQGWEIEDYLEHLEQYRRAGTDLATLPIVGVGSVCRRQGTDEAVQLFTELNAAGIKCHAFGFKLTGLRACSRLLASADSRSKPPGAVALL